MLYSSVYITVTISILVINVLNSEAYSEDQAATEVCPAEQRETWSYRGDNGPQYWGENYPLCNGNVQSPIELSSSDAVADPSLQKLDLSNSDQPISKGKIINNGHTVTVIPDDRINRIISINGTEYELKQFNFHWGNSSHMGSEHTLNGVQYAMEMHLYHMSEGKQLAAVGIFLQEVDDANDELQKIVDQLSDVRYRGEEAELKSNLSLRNLLPPNLGSSYYRYQGSLTTPQCAEGVTWSVIPDVIFVGKAQMEEFRQKLYTVSEEEAEESCKLVKNFRPLQSVNGRVVSVTN